MKKNGIVADVMPFWLNEMVYVTDNELAEDIEYVYTKDEKEKLSSALAEEFWKLTSVNDVNYGIGNLYAPAPYGWAANISMMEKYNLSYEDLNCPLWEMEDVFDRVTEGEKENDSFSAFSFVPGYMDYYIPVVFIDRSIPVVFWMTGENETITVSNLFETDEMQRLIETLNKFDEKGYLRVSGVQSEEDNFFMQADYNGFPVFRKDRYDTWTNHNGLNLLRINYYNHTDCDLMTEIQVIPTWSNRKKDAAEFLTFVFTNADAAELLMQKDELDSDSKEQVYQRNLSNVLITREMAPYEDEEKKALNEDELKNIVITRLSGFQFDDSKVKKQARAVRDIYQEQSLLQKLYMHHTYGEKNICWQDYYKIYVEKLKDSGIDDVIAEMNQQIKEYLENENRDM